MDQGGVVGELLGIGETGEESPSSEEAVGGSGRESTESSDVNPFAVLAGTLAGSSSASLEADLLMGHPEPVPTAPSLNRPPPGLDDEFDDFVQTRRTEGSPLRGGGGSGSVGLEEEGEASQSQEGGAERDPSPDSSSSGQEGSC